MGITDKSVRFTIAAADSFFWAGLVHATSGGSDHSPNVFNDLFFIQERVRTQWNWKPSDRVLLVMAVDRNHALHGVAPKNTGVNGMLIDEVDYRDYYPSILPTSGVQGSGGSDNRNGEETRLRPTLAPRLNFLLGGIAARLSGSHPGAISERPGILVMAHHYELKDSLMELTRRGADVGIAFYRSLMEPRWESFGLFSAQSPIKFYDLTPSADEAAARVKRNGASPEAPRSAVAELF